MARPDFLQYQAYHRPILHTPHSLVQCDIVQELIFILRLFHFNVRTYNFELYPLVYFIVPSSTLYGLTRLEYDFKF